METIKARKVVGGKAQGPALVTRMPMNFTAAFSKVSNLVKRSRINDQHHDLFKQDVKGKVMVFPAVIGSTFTGMVILQLIHDNCPPAAIIVSAADSLLVSGSILGQTWFNRGIPILERPGDDLFDKIHTNDRIEVDADAGEIRLLDKP